MKKYLILLIILIVTVGATSTFLEMKPTLKTIYIHSNETDTKLETCHNQSPISLAQGIHDIQKTTKTLIELGETYTVDQNLATEFKEFDNAYANLQTIISNLNTCDLKTANLPDETLAKFDITTQELVTTLKSEQAAMLNTHQTVIKTIEQFLATTENFEKLYYTASTKDAIHYFSDLYTELDTLSTTYNEYVDARQTYEQTKEQLFNQLSN